MPSFGSFLGRSVSEAAGFGAGLAIGPALHPVVQEVVNRTWALHPDRPLGVGEAAAIVAEAVELTPWGIEEAKATGFNEERFRALLGEALNGPGIGTLLELLRRSDEVPIDFEHGLRKAKLEKEWDAALKNLRDLRLAPAVLSLAIVRGIVKDPGFLPLGPPTTVGKVQAFPVSALNALKEASFSGIDRERLRVLTAIAGRPMGPEAAASAVFRQILERVDYDRAIAEGDVRNEWADAIFEQARQIPSVADYVALHLRGHIDAAGMHAGAERHGMSPADTDRIYLARGRPAAPGQMATAVARGITGPLGRPMDREQFLLGIAESDIRPEWGPMLFDSIYLYPSLFQLNRLVDAKAIDTATAADWAHKAREAPEVVAKLRVYWDSLGGKAADKHVAKAETQLWTTLHRSYMAGESDDATATEHLTTLGVPAAAQSRVLALWQSERALVRKQLTPTQIKKAYAKAETNPATGLPWTRDDAIARLVAQGMSVNDANSLLDL